jgi:hypothetical protein
MHLCLKIFNYLAQRGIALDNLTLFLVVLARISFKPRPAIHRDRRIVRAYGEHSDGQNSLASCMPVAILHRLAALNNGGKFMA